MKPGTAKQKGAATESFAVEWLRRNGAPYAERRHLHGSADQGDIAGIPNVCIEVKSAARWTPKQWVAELEVEMVNSEASTGAVLARPKGVPDPDGWIVMMPMEVWRRLMVTAGYLQESLASPQDEVKLGDTSK